MEIKNKTIILVILNILILVSHIKGEKNSFITHRGMVSLWLAVDDKARTGYRIQPEFDFYLKKERTYNIDAQISYELSADDSTTQINEVLEASSFYRFYVRGHGEQSELRIGLQKINFGPAKILRSLIWFDSLDYRDPLQISNGVRGILYRYYFVNNSNLWLWALYGNESLKGIERIKTDKDHIEGGGRIQFAVPKGEVGLSYHSRKIEPDSLLNISGKMSSELTEHRIAADIDLDIEIGFWLEESISYYPAVKDYRENYLTIGIDYTFAALTGIHLLYEHMIADANAFEKNSERLLNMSVVSCDFPLGIQDNIKIAYYIDNDGGKNYFFAGLSRAYNNIMYDVGVFESPLLEEGVFRGTGFYLMGTYNY